MKNKKYKVRKFVAVVMLLSFVLNLFSANVYAIENKTSKNINNSSNITIGITYSKAIQRYIEAVEKTGANYYLLPVVKSKSEAKRELAKIDGLIICGGNDVDPNLYDETESEKLEESAYERDMSDILMLNVAVEKDMPVMGICRGMQIMNIARGGTMYQDISSEYPGFNNEIIHRDPDLKKWPLHMIDIEEDSFLYDALKVRTTEVMSWHHQAIEKLGENTKVVAVSEDGIIEGIQYTDKTYMMGVQFHPETAVQKYNNKQLELFSSLVEYSLDYRERCFSKIESPDLAAAVLSKYNEIEVYWDPVEDASGYAVYYKKTDDNEYSFLGYTSESSIKVGDLKEGTEYHFNVVSCIKRGDFYLESDDYVKAKARTLKKLNDIDVSEFSKSSVNITWERNSDVTGYQISRSSSKTGTYVICTIDKNNINSKIVNIGTEGKPYYYKVRTFKLVAGKKIYGPWSEVFAYENILGTPQNLKLSLYGHDDIDIRWTKVSDADGYAVYYKNSNMEDYKLHIKTTGTNTKKANVLDGNKYEIKVVPYFMVEGKCYYGVNFAKSSIYTLKKIENVSVKKYGTKKIKVSWKDIYGQTGYDISRSSQKNGTYRICSLNSSTAQYILVNNKKNKKTYYYKIRAYKMENGKKIYGPWSSAKGYKNL